jgi:hypothetical protein
MISRGKEEQQARRSARLAAALRENLKRRKAQARGRAQEERSDERSNVPRDDAAATERKTAAPDFRRNRSSE